MKIINLRLIPRVLGNTYQLLSSHNFLQIFCSSLLFVAFWGESAALRRGSVTSAFTSDVVSLPSGPCTAGETVNYIARCFSRWWLIDFPVAATRVTLHVTEVVVRWGNRRRTLSLHSRHSSVDIKILGTKAICNNFKAGMEFVAQLINCRLHLCVISRRLRVFTVCLLSTTHLESLLNNA